MMTLMTLHANRERLELVHHATSRSYDVMVVDHVRDVQDSGCRVHANTYLH